MKTPTTRSPSSDRKPRAVGARPDAAAGKGGAPKPRRKPAAERSDEAPVKAESRPADRPSGDKLQKILAQAGLGSRREMEQLIAEGRVTINGRAAQLGDRVITRDNVLVDGRRLRASQPGRSAARVLIYNKPEGEICTRKDPERRPTVFDALPTPDEGRWISVGRLDFNTSGLMIFTTDGDLANALMHPSANIEREYICRVLGEVDEAMCQRLLDGVLLEDGLAQFNHIAAARGDGANRWFAVSVMEGRNREVRRLWESQGVQVNRLKRIRYGRVVLSARLKQGQWMELPPKEVAALYQMAGLDTPSPVRLSPEEKERMERQQRKSHRRVHEKRPPPSERPQRARRGDQAERDAAPRNADKRPVRADRPERVDRAARGERPQRSERPARTDRPVRTERPARTERAERTERPARPTRDAAVAPSAYRDNFGDKRDRSEARQPKTARSAGGRTAESARRSDTYSARSEKIGRSERATRPERSVRSERSERAPYAGKPARSASGAKPAGPKGAPYAGRPKSGGQKSKR